MRGVWQRGGVSQQGEIELVVDQAQQGVELAEAFSALS